MYTDYEIICRVLALSIAYAYKIVDKYPCIQAQIILGPSTIQ